METEITVVNAPKSPEILVMETLVTNDGQPSVVFMFITLQGNKRFPLISEISNLPTHLFKTWKVLWIDRKVERSWYELA